MPRTSDIMTLMTSAATWAVGVFILCAGTGAYAQLTATDSVEREMEFTDELADATELYNAEQYAKALQIFEKLVQLYSDLDTDGYAALGYGDCLAALGRLAEARRIYETAITPDAHRNATVRWRLQELQLKGPITDEVLEQLRAGMRENVNSRFASAWRLARAIQKQAVERLAEAAEAFRTAAAAPGEKPCSSQQLNNQAVYLDELVDDLKFLIDEIEGHLTIPRNIHPRPGASEPPTQELRVQQVLRLPGGRQVNIEIEQRTDASLSVKIDGNAVPLSAAEQQLIRRHGDRINAIILKAAGISGASAEQPGAK